MATNLKIENVLIQVKCQLKLSQIKLWLAPYCVEEMPCEPALEVKKINIKKHIKNVRIIDS